MIRLFGLLFIGIFATLMIAGQDHGQKRYGLMLADKQATEAATALSDTTAVNEVKAVFIPAQPVMQPVQAVTQVASPQPVAAPVAAQPAPSLPAPEIPGGQLFTVATKGANVRQGPATTFAVLDSLTGGEQVLVVDEDNPTDGWSKVRIEGDGVEGYIATRLLTQSY